MAKTLMLRNVRLSYANLFEARETPSGDLKFSSALILDPEEPSTQELIDTVDEIIAECFPKARKVKNPIKDGDEEHPGDEVYEGKLYVNATSRRKPQVVDRKVQPIIDEEEAFSGCYANVTVYVKDYDVDNQKGVSVGLNNVQILKNDPELRLAGAKSASEEFEELEEEEEAPAKKKKAAPAKSAPAKSKAKPVEEEEEEEDEDFEYEEKPAKKAAPARKAMPKRR